MQPSLTHKHSGCSRGTIEAEEQQEDEPAERKEGRKKGNETRAEADCSEGLRNICHCHRRPHRDVHSFIHFLYTLRVCWRLLDESPVYRRATWKDNNPVLTHSLTLTRTEPRRIQSFHFASPA